MFNGEESIRIRSSLSSDELEAVVEHALDRVGRVKFFRRGEFEVRSRRFESALATTAISGYLARGRRDGEWVVRVEYSVAPSALCWVIIVFGVLFVLAGLLILLAPNNTKSEVQRAVALALRDARDDAEE